MVHNDLEKDLVRPLDGDNDQNLLRRSWTMIHQIMIQRWQWPRPQYLTDANGKSRTGVDINQAAAKAVQAAADDNDDDRIRQVASFDRIYARIEKNSIGQQKKHASGSDGVCTVEESPYLDETDVFTRRKYIVNHDLLHYDSHVVDEEITSFDQSDVELATDYQSQAECGGSTSDSDDQMRVEPLRDSPTVQTMDKSSNKDSWSERRGEDDVREEESLLTAKQSFTSESEKGQSVEVPPRQKKSKSKAKRRKVSEDSTRVQARKDIEEQTQERKVPSRG